MARSDSQWNKRVEGLAQHIELLYENIRYGGVRNKVHSLYNGDVPALPILNSSSSLSATGRSVDVEFVGRNELAPAGLA